jgi:hypothetical protein
MKLPRIADWLLLLVLLLLQIAPMPQACLGPGYQRILLPPSSAPCGHTRHPQLIAATPAHRRLLPAAVVFRQRHELGASTNTGLSHLQSTSFSSPPSKLQPNEPVP